jgi:hypothetical protein
MLPARLRTGAPAAALLTMDAATLAVLLGWAVHLSSYSRPEHPPTVEFRPQAFFVDNACGGRRCRALGWYNDSGIVYLDERVRDKDSVFVRSLVVHELVHYLQDLSGRFGPDCEDQVKRENEAYALQRSYVAEAHGQAAFIRVTHRGCRKA